MDAPVSVSIALSPAASKVGVSDWLPLIRPRLAAMAVATVAAGWLCGAPRAAHPGPLWAAIVGVGLLFAGASALNQLLESSSDALMERTSRRPIPAGILSARQVLWLGALLSASGVAVLAVANPLTAAIGGLASAVYVFVYTPLKKATELNTLIGAIPGAAPPIIGWAAATGRCDAAAWFLFLIVFLWQIPHFLAIAWIYREQYARAGIRVLCVRDPAGRYTGRQMIRYSAALVVACGAAGEILCGWQIAAALVAIAVGFLSTAIAFAVRPTNCRAKLVFRASLLVLPLAILLLAAGATFTAG